MVFVSGPRQVGKTTLAREILPDPAGYLNWDVPEHRDAILRGRLPATETLVFDELHKFHRWRAWLKGLYDRQDGVRILVTGSGRLDYYRHGGDSLQGRYHHLRLHPLSVAELSVTDAGGLRRLLDLGGFPEPWLSGSMDGARRWSREYRSRLVEDDIRGLERVEDLSALETLVIRLTDLVGAPLSVNALREDLGVSHRTVSRWLDILERLYAIVRLPPFGAPRVRAIRKSQKHYHYDWVQVHDDAARFENLVAMHLLKWVHREQDIRGRDVEIALLSRRRPTRGGLRGHGPFRSHTPDRGEVERSAGGQVAAIPARTFSRRGRHPDQCHRDRRLPGRRTGFGYSLPCRFWIAWCDSRPSGDSVRQLNLGCPLRADGRCGGLSVAGFPCGPPRAGLPGGGGPA